MKILKASFVLVCPSLSPCVNSLSAPSAINQCPLRALTIKMLYIKDYPCPCSSSYICVHAAYFILTRLTWNSHILLNKPRFVYFCSDLSSPFADSVVRSTRVWWMKSVIWSPLDLFFAKLSSRNRYLFHDYFDRSQWLMVLCKEEIFSFWFDALHAIFSQGQLHLLFIHLFSDRDGVVLKRKITIYRSIVSYRNEKTFFLLQTSQ